MGRFLRLVLLLTTIAIASLPGDASSGEPRYYKFAYPVAGVSLGTGWNVYSDMPAPSLCIEFTPVLDEPVGLVQAQLRRVQDHSELAESLKISTEARLAGVGVISGGGGVKAEYFSESKFNHDNVYAYIEAQAIIRRDRVDITVDNSAKSIDEILDEIINQGGKKVPSVKLSKAARRILKREGVDSFVKTCGTGFVTAILKGGGVLGRIEITTEDLRTYEKIAINVDYSSGTWSAAANLQQAVSKATKNSRFNLQLQLEGGSGVKVPTNLKELQTYLTDLMTTVEKNPVSIQLVVLPYQWVHKWPKDKKIPASSDLILLPDVRALTRLYTLNRTINDILLAESRQVWLGNTNVNSLRKTQTTLNEKRKVLADRSKLCVTEEKCSESDKPGDDSKWRIAWDYEYRTTLPMEKLRSPSYGRLKALGDAEGVATRHYHATKRDYDHNFGKATGCCSILAACCVEADRLARNLKNAEDALRAATHNRASYENGRYQTDVAREREILWVEMPMRKRSNDDVHDFVPEEELRKILDEIK